MFKFTLIFLSLFTTLNVYGQIIIPNTFNAGTAAKASEVNANFQALADSINKLNARVTKLEGNITASDLIGTYQLNGFAFERNGGTTWTQNSDFVYTGTMSVNENGTLSVTTNVAGWTTNFQKVPPTIPNAYTDIVNPAVSAFTPSDGTTKTTTFNWTLSGNLFKTEIGNFSISAGGKVLLLAFSSSSGNTTGTRFFIFTKL